MDIKGFKSYDSGFQWCLKPCKWLLMVKSPENGYKWFYEPCKWFFSGFNAMEMDNGGFISHSNGY